MASSDKDSGKPEHSSDGLDRALAPSPKSADGKLPANPDAAEIGQTVPTTSKADEIQREEKLKSLRSQLKECDSTIGEINQRRANSRNLNIHRRKSIMYNADLEERSWLAWKDRLKQQIEELLRAPSGDEDIPALPDTNKPSRTVAVPGSHKKPKRRSTFRQHVLRYLIDHRGASTKDLLAWCDLEGIRGPKTWYAGAGDQRELLAIYAANPDIARTIDTYVSKVRKDAEKLRNL